MNTCMFMYLVLIFNNTKEVNHQLHCISTVRSVLIGDFSINQKVTYVYYVRTKKQ